MTHDYRILANPHIRDLTPYQPGKPIEELERELGITGSIKLASNENAMGPSPKAIQAATEALLKSHFYPDGGCFELKQSLGQFLGIDRRQLTIGNGSENVLEIIIKSYLGQEEEAVISEYAFLTISLLIKSYNGKIVKVPAKNYAHDIQAMIKAVTDKTRLVFIVNPNNPTGTYTTHTDLILLLESIPSNVMVVIDEAYYEYSDKPDYPNTLSLMSTYPNLIVTRTFSKVYGLAALRLGYAVSCLEVADILNRARLPFNVNAIAAIAARAALYDRDHILRTVQMNQQGMLQYEEELRKLSIEHIPSLGNFVTINVKQNAMVLYQKLLHQGIIVRPLVPYDLPSHLRITVGTVEQNERFFKALHHVLRG
jgi:histidinol-phosphate aminotransferase